METKEIAPVLLDSPKPPKLKKTTWGDFFCCLGKFTFVFLLGVVMAGLIVWVVLRRMGLLGGKKPPEPDVFAIDLKFLEVNFVEFEKINARLELPENVLTFLKEKKFSTFDLFVEVTKRKVEGLFVSPEKTEKVIKGLEVAPSLDFDVENLSIETEYALTYRLEFSEGKKTSQSPPRVVSTKAGGVPKRPIVEVEGHNEKEIVLGFKSFTPEDLNGFPLTGAEIFYTTDILTPFEDWQKMPIALEPPEGFDRPLVKIEISNGRRGFFRISAENKKGKSELSEIYEMTTAVANCQNLAAEDFTVEALLQLMHEIKLKIKINQKIMGKCPPLWYNLKWYKIDGHNLADQPLEDFVANLEWQNFNSTKVDRAQGNAIDIKNLESNSDYIFEIRARTFQGLTGLKLFHGKTVDLSPPQEIKQVRPGHVYSDSLALSVEYDHVVPITGMEARLGEKIFSVNFEISSKRKEEIEIKELLPATPYEVAVFVSNEKGSFEYPQRLNFTTLAAGRCTKAGDAQWFTKNGDFVSCKLAKLGFSTMGNEKAVRDGIRQWTESNKGRFGMAHGISGECAQCIEEATKCSKTNCIAFCNTPKLLVSQECRDCTRTKCKAQFLTCSGLPDAMTAPEVDQRIFNLNV